MHGQTENALGGAFADREITRLIAQVGKGALQMQGQGIIDGRGDAGLLQFLLQGSRWSLSTEYWAQTEVHSGAT